MATKYVKFSPENEQAAEDYSDFLDAALAQISSALVPWAARYEENFTADCQQGHLQRDTNLNWVVGWYGPPFVFDGQEVSPVSGDTEARALGVLVDTPDWYPLD